MKAVYIAGPFRADCPWSVEQNVRDAEIAALHLAESGYVPVCPHSMFRFFDKSLPDEFWLTACQELLTRCDAVLLLEGWQESKGSVAEKKLAEDLGLPIVRRIRDLDEVG